MKVENFISKEKEPHSRRHKAILVKYPEIKNLYGYDYRTKYFVGIVLMIQLFMCSMAVHLDWCSLFILTYILSGTCNNFVSLAIHECCHNLLFQKQRWNEYFSILANIPIGVPMAISFKKYHLEHHYYMGDFKKDADIPTEMEQNIFRGIFGKTMFLICNPILYGLRPFLKNPKPFEKLEIINIMIQFLVNYIVYDWYGVKALFYLLGGTFLGMGLHPLAAHFISEHYVSKEIQETYSYYGNLNYLTLNVGYHNEHHDFPKVSGLRLPFVREIAKEYYDIPIKSYDSWCRQIFDFIFDPKMTVQSRIQRKL
jgi:sphingolipid delta-4 desaturase